MNFSRISALEEALTTEREGSAMLGLPHRSIFTEEVKIGERTVPGRQLKWSVFRDFPVAKMYSTVEKISFVREIHRVTGNKIGGAVWDRNNLWRSCRRSARI